MPLVKITLETAIKAALEKNQKPNGGDNPEQQIEASINDLAKDLTDAIHNYIKSATIITPHGPGSIS
ncbi:hypothetical protein [Tenacibaculum halocynthiae]|uniref:hypothetical protein n=1 Tax=Tenacibaculum halocynthiae TaxID=1254437 RepID=UPI00262148C7|nr:hypothetical protein [uncultured Tenacibaculum sp.]